MAVLSHSDCNTFENRNSSRKSGGYFSFYLPQKKFEGTRVTVETFLAWKAQFDKELQALRSEKEREEEKNKKFTGRELFQKDDTLNESDLTFLGDGKASAVLYVNSDDNRC